MGSRNNNDKYKNIHKKVSALLLVSMLTLVDIAPLLGYAVDTTGEIEITEEVEPLEEGLEEESGELEADEHQGGQVTPEEWVGEEPKDNLGDKEEIEITEEEKDEPVIQKETEGGMETTGELEEQEEGQEYGVMMMSLNATPTYKMATDADFSGTSNGNFRYIGTDEYVEIPHKIKGVNVTSYYNMFGEKAVKGVKSTNKNVNNMSAMFRNMETTSLDVSQLDTSGATNMAGMFAESFRDKYNLTKIIGLENFDTRQVRDMSSMFSNSRVTNVDISNFKVPNLTIMASMFSHSSAMELDFGGFNTSKVTSLSSLFYGSSVSVVKGIENFDTSNVTNMSSVFYATPNLSGVDVSNFDTSKVTNMTRMFFQSGATYLDLRSFDTSNVTRMDNMFQNSKATTIDGLENFDTSRVTNMTAMFSNAQARKLDLRSFDSSKITNMVSMFESTHATEILLGEGFDTSKVTNMSRMFRNSKAKTLDLSMFNTSRVTTMERMFDLSNATALNLRSFNTERVTNMERMFEDSKATTIYITSFDTSYVTTMKQMFNKSLVKELDLSSFDMRSVNETEWMLSGTSITKAISKSQDDADKLNSSEGIPSGLKFEPKYKVAREEDFIGTINGSFRYVGKEEFVEIPSNIRGVMINSYRNMFEGTSVKGVISTNTNVTDMREMFKNTSSTDLDVSTINTEKVTDMTGMFENSKATQLDLRGFVTDNVVNMGNMFKGTNVGELDLGSFNLTKTTNTANMFQNTKASKGYVRTDAELEKVNNSSNKPSSLTFSVWGITVTSNPTGWTNGMIDLKVDSKAGNTNIRETELVNNEGENLLKRKHFRPEVVTRYMGATATITQNVSVPEWGVSDAIRFDTKRGNGDFQFYWDVSDTSQWLGLQATQSVYVKNVGKTRILFGHNGLSGASNHWVNPGESKRIVSTGTFRTSHSFIQFHVRSSDDINAIFWGHKVELGNKVSEYTPPLETTTEEGVFPVYNNGTYIFRSTDTNGETRTVAHTVNNIDRANPTAVITPSTTGQTSQDVTLYVQAKDNLSGVDYITLPDGKRVNGYEAEYVAKENKDYVFKITDKAGNTETITHKVNNIDRSLVVVTATVDNKNWTRDPVNITVTSEESASKLLDIKMINSPIEGRNLLKGTEFEEGKEEWFLQTSNQGMEGNYEIIELEGGGKAIKVNITESGSTMDVSIKQKIREDIEERKLTLSWGILSVEGDINLYANMRTVNEQGEYYMYRDNTKSLREGYPTRIYNTETIGEGETLDNIWLRTNPNKEGETGNTVANKPKLEVGDLTPWTPAPEDIKLINNSKTYPVIANGLYTFEASYANGVTSEVSVNISNIDLDAPTIEVLNNPEEWSEEDEVELEINITDNNQSGVKVITMPDGTTTTGTSLKYKVTENGEYSFTVEDNIGNKETHVITVDKLMIPYFFYIYDGNGEPLEGAGFELLRDGIAHARTESDANGLADFGKVPPTGKYTIKQIKAPDGYIVDPEEKDVDVEDEADPIEIINYPRGSEMPSTGTRDMVVLGSIIIITVIGMFVIKRIKGK